MSKTTELLIQHACFLAALSVLGAIVVFGGGIK